jgi:hypothetical protein
MTHASLLTRDTSCYVPFFGFLSSLYRLFSVHLYLLFPLTFAGGECLFFAGVCVITYFIASRFFSFLFSIAGASRSSSVSHTVCAPGK